MFSMNDTPFPLIVCATMHVGLPLVAVLVFARLAFLDLVRALAVFLIARDLRRTRPAAMRAHGGLVFGFFRFFLLPG